MLKELTKNFDPLTIVFIKKEFEKKSKLNKIEFITGLKDHLL